MRNWLKTLLFLSAFSPALLTIAYVRYDLYGLTRDVIQIMVVGIIGTILPVLIIRLIEKSSEQIVFSAKKIKSSDFMLLAFVGSYLLPIILRASDIEMTRIIFITLAIILILWWSSSIPHHPLLRVIKFRFYEVESESGVVYTLISKREILDPKQIKSVKKISSTMLMESPT